LRVFLRTASKQRKDPRRLPSGMPLLNERLSLCPIS
jgi:hypothetical protein